MKKGKKKQKKKNSPPKKENEILTKEVGTYNGFLIFDKIEEKNENEFHFRMNDLVEPEFKDWMIIDSTKTKSRFTNLFQDILESDKKMDQKNNEKNIINEEKLLPNDIMDDIDDGEFNFFNEKNIFNDKKENIEEQMKNMNLNNNIINNDFNSDDKINISNDNLNTNIINNNNNVINNNQINPFFNNKNTINTNNNKINIINNNFQNNNKINTINNPNLININNISNNNNLLMNYNSNLNNNSNNNNMINNNTIKPFMYIDKNYNDYYNSNSGYVSNAPTAPSSIDGRSSIFSFLSNSSNFYFDKNKIPNNTNKIDYYNFPNKNINNEPSPRKSEKKFDLNIDIKRIIYLEDRRTTLMIKNIPNKFNRELLLNIINQNFKGAYDIFILPTDANRYKNFGYSFINFTSSYYIPFFYYLFHNKKWSSTNSKKVCEITYSKIQGKNNLYAHYSKQIIYKNDAKKTNDSEIKFKIPNEFSAIFFSAFPNYKVEKYDTYFVTKLPFRY